VNAPAKEDEAFTSIVNDPKNFSLPKINQINIDII
jgi:hypothetical protein